jgi:hypothetical protein
MTTATDILFVYYRVFVGAMCVMLTSVPVKAMNLADDLEDAGQEDVRIEVECR